MAATGLLGVNPYYKGVKLDVSKPVNLAIQLEQKERAKQEALDKYFMDYEKSLNSAGMRQQDQDVFLRKLANNKDYYFKNREKILNPSKYGAEAQSQYMAGFKDILSDINKSKQLAANGKVLSTAIIDARKNNKTIPKEVADAIYNNELSMGDPMFQAFDPVNFDAYDKNDATKYANSIYSKIKLSESKPKRIYNPEFNEVSYETVNDISNKSFGQIENLVASELQRNRGLVDDVKSLARDKNELNKLAKLYQDFSGKKMNPNSLQDVATAYTISLKPEAKVTYTTPRPLATGGGKEDTSGEDNPLHPSSLIEEIRGGNPNYLAGGIKTTNENLIDVTNQFGGYNLYKTSTKDGVVLSPAINVVYDKANDRFYVKGPSKFQEPEYLTPQAFKTKIIVSNPDISSKVKGWGKPIKDKQVGYKLPDGKKFNG